MKKKWRQKPESDVNGQSQSKDPSGHDLKQPQTEAPGGCGTEQSKEENKPEIVIHELAYYEELYNGVIERSWKSFDTLYDLSNKGDPVACYYLGMFLEKVASNVISLLYARKWFERGWKLGNKDCMYKYADIDERISKMTDFCPYCGSRLKTISGQYGGHFRGCSRYPQCDFTCDPRIHQYYELNGVFYRMMRVGNPIGKGYITEQDLFQDYFRFGLKKKPGFNQ